jgi:hypothetical protein
VNIKNYEGKTVMDYMDFLRDEQIIQLLKNNFHVQARENGRLLAEGLRDRVKTQ